MGIGSLSADSRCLSSDAVATEFRSVPEANGCFEGVLSWVLLLSSAPRIARPSKRLGLQSTLHPPAHLHPTTSSAATIIIDKLHHLPSFGSCLRLAIPVKCTLLTTDLSHFDLFINPNGYIHLKNTAAYRIIPELAQCRDPRQGEGPELCKEPLRRGRGVCFLQSRRGRQE